MKKLLIALLVLVVLVIGAVVAAPFLIPVETYKQQIAQQVEAATGRTLTIAGPVEISFLPSIGVEAEDVRLANVEGASEADMINLKTLAVDLKLWPLLRGAVEVDRFVLIEPQINLEVDQDGRGNWEFGAPGEVAAGDQGADETPGQEDGGGLPVSEIRLGDVRIEDGTITFRDAGAGTVERLEDVDLTVSLPDLQSRLELTGSARYQDEAVELTAAVDEPLALIEGGSSATSASVSAEPVSFSFEGLVEAGENQTARGALELDVTSIRDLAAWLSQPLELETEGLQTLSIAGKLDATPAVIRFADAAIALDDIRAEGQFEADLRAQVPALRGALEVGEVDLNRYLPTEAAPAEEAGTEGAAPTGTPAEAPGWSTEPIPIPRLDLAELDFELTVNGLKFEEIELGRSVLALALQDAVLSADLQEFALYGGTGAGRLEVDTGAEQPAIASRFELQGLQALPFFEAAADFDRLEGTGSVKFDLTTAGRSQMAFMRNLGGEGQLLFEDGAVVGVNLAQMVRNIGAAFTGGEGEIQKTDFAELGGSFTIERGVLRNDDLTLQAPVLRLSGAGTVDIKDRTLDYRIEPKAAATLEGQGGTQDVAGILVPVNIIGTWSDPEFRPDLGSVLESAGQSSEAVRQQLEQLEGRKEELEEAAETVEQQLRDAQESGDVKGLVEGLTGALGGRQPNQGGQPQEDGGTEPQQEADPAQQLLRGLFRN